MPACAFADHDPTDSAPALLASTATLVGMTAADLTDARLALSQMGDPARRTVLEAVAGRSQRSGPFLEDLTGLSTADLRHRVRTLCGAGLVIKSRHHILSASPDRLKQVSEYFDTLRTVAVLNHPDRAS